MKENKKSLPQFRIYNERDILSRFEVGNEVSDEQVESICKAFMLLPQRLQKRFFREKWKIIISDEYWIKSGSFEIWIKSNVYGYCSNPHRRIFIRSSSPDLLKVFWHEFGHFLNIKEFLLCNRQPFREIYNMEKMNIRDLYKSTKAFEYGILNKNEFFAEIFAFFMTDAESLKKQAIKSYMFMQAISSKWK